MAKHVLNRRELRKQADQADQQERPTANTGAAGVKGPKKRGGEVTSRLKPAAAPKPRKPRKKKEPVRLRARWGVFDGGMKQVAIFDYNQRTAADQKVADLVAKKKAVHFLQIVKDPMPEPVPIDASVP